MKLARRGSSTVANDHRVCALMSLNCLSSDMRERDRRAMDIDLSIFPFSDHQRSSVKIEDAEDHIIPTAITVTWMPQVDLFFSSLT